MHVDAQIVAELRAMLLNGATPSRLIRHIASRHDNDPNWPAYVEPYFAEAFSVITFAMDHHSPEDLDKIDLSELNGEILRDIIGRKAAWWGSVGDAPGSWCDGLSVSPDDLTMIEQIRPESHPALADSWESLNPGVKEFIRNSMVNAQGYYERMRVLVRLVERLQEQIVERERQNEEATA